MGRFRVIAFDCDGVMFDSLKANVSYFNHILAHIGLQPMNSEQTAHAHIHTTSEALSYLLGGDAGRIAKAQAYRKTMPYARFIREMEIEPCLKPLLKALRPRYRTAIATNRTDTIERVLEEFDLTAEFDLVVGALDTPRPKPFPDPLLKILTHFEIAPNQMLFVGDSSLDEQAAQAAGVSFAAYRNPSLDAEYHITDLKELAEILETGPLCES
jgi:HAD superfamily hydrolase (TIGR01549 family)